MSEIHDKLISRKPIIVEYDEVWVDVGKRVYSQMDIIIVFLNCVSACFSISAGVSLIPSNNMNYAQFCDLGNAIGQYVQCPYVESPEFLCILGVCIIYFSAFIIFKILWTFEFMTNDLRYYISCDMVINSVIHKCFVLFGIVFTFAGGFTGIGYVIHNGSTDSLGLIFTFMGVNFYTFASMFRGRYRVLYDSEVTLLFPDPVYIRFPDASLSNLSGVLINHRDLFDDIMRACVSGLNRSGETCNTGDQDMYLSKYGNPSQLRQVLQTLSVTATLRS